MLSHTHTRTLHPPVRFTQVETLFNRHTIITFKFMMIRLHTSGDMPLERMGMYKCVCTCIFFCYRPLVPRELRQTWGILEVGLDCLKCSLHKTVRLPNVERGQLLC